MIMKCSNGYSSTVTFRKDRETEVCGSVTDNRGIPIVKLFGHYDRFLQKLAFDAQESDCSRKNPKL